MHDGLEDRPGSSFRPAVPPSGAAGDFLGLGAELGRVPPRAVPAQQQPATPPYPQPLADTRFAPWHGHDPRALPQHPQYGAHAHHAPQHPPIQHAPPYAPPHPAHVPHHGAQHAWAQHAPLPHAPMPHPASPHAPAQYAAPHHAPVPHAHVPRAYVQHAVPQHALVQDGAMPPTIGPHAASPHPMSHGASPYAAPSAVLHHANERHALPPDHAASHAHGFAQPASPSPRTQPANASHATPPNVPPPAVPRTILPQYARPRAVQQVLMPPQELLPPQHELAVNWPEVRTNTWRVAAQPPPALAPSVASTSVPPGAGAVDPSWLLQLDDASIPPAHPSFVPSSAPANASFHDGTVVAHRVAPWFVRALCVAAGLFLCAVITRTILVRSSREPAAPQVPVQPIAQSTPRAQHELVAPNEADEIARGRPGQRVKKPVTAGMNGAASADQRSFLERDAPTEPPPESPALVVYDLPDTRSVSASSAPLDRADADRWLAEQSRASAPLSDVGAVRAADPVAAASGTPTAAGASGIWEGATIPVESLAGGLRLSTPGVGRVRVRLEGGTRAEGRLTAIGQGRVWIETESGPLVIESAKMRGLEQIAERGAGSGPESPKRQRVRTDGGVFFGRVLARDGRTVTLITDAGTRLTVEADEVEDVDADAPASPGSARTDR